MPLSEAQQKSVEKTLRDPYKGASSITEELAIVEADIKKALGENHPLYNKTSQIHRFLIARKLKLPDTLKMIEDHVAWRAANLPVQITDPIITELKKGKAEQYGLDASGRPLVLVRSGKFDPKVRDLHVAVSAVVWLVERAVASTDGEFTILYDRTGFSLSKNWDYEYIKTVVSTLSDNYPERLGAVYLYPATMVLAGLWGLIRPFVDPRTREKVQIITSDKALLNLVPSEYVPVAAGGTSTHMFDPAMYNSLKPGSITEELVIVEAQPAEGQGIEEYAVTVNVS